MSHCFSVFSTPWRRRLSTVAAASVVLLSVIPVAVAFPDAGLPAGQITSGGDAYLVISEVMTGGASASDEFIELYNPGSVDLSLAGVELVYVTASGATITRKASWTDAADAIPPHAHLLVANEAGIHAAAADVTYAGGLSAAGGSVALRLAGSDVAIDAVGWGSAASSWLEGTPAPAPEVGHSLERLPGGSGGSTQDTDDNSVDLVDRAPPDPQNGAAPPVPDASSTPTPTPSSTPTPTPTPTSTPVEVMTITEARAAPDGSVVTVEGVALTGSAFADGGGFVEDPTAGISVLVADGGFARGDELRVRGVVDDRYGQRTIRVAGEDVTVDGTGTDPAAMTSGTGNIGESLEGTLVETVGMLAGSATQLSGAVAFDIDDGTGAVRIYVGEATGIDTAAWAAGVELHVRGVVGQRDSSGTGSAGYRLMPRDTADVLELPLPTPAPTASDTSSPSESATPSALPLLTIAEARAADANSTLRIRGIVTLPTGLLQPGSAAIEDATGAIFLRPSDEAGPLFSGQEVELVGTRSTWTGMESVRFSVPPTVVRTAALPRAADRVTGAIGEADEAHRIKVRGEVASAVVRSSAQNVYFDLDDGSGPLRVYLAPGAGIATAAIVRGATLEITGVLLQETTGKQPERGYRLWPVAPGDVNVVTVPVVGSDLPAEGAEPSGGVPGGGWSAGSGRTAEPVASIRPQPAPLLVLARPTLTSRLPVVDHAVAAPVGGVTPHPAIPLALAASALAGAGGLLARNGLLQRLAARLKSDVSAPDGEAAASPELIPLGAAPAPASPGIQSVALTGSSPTHEHEGILPRT